jgi:hypothetical protein
MQALAVIKSNSKLPLDAFLASQEERFEPGAAVVVITPSSNIQLPLRRLVNRSTVVTAVLLDAATFGGEANTADTARGLVASGMYVYVVRRGAELGRALDSRFILSPLPYTGMGY